ncbi:MAG: kinase/pyrophosphorylase [Candidatus Competibacterales bacterium]
MFAYSARIDAINFTLNHDDGSTLSHLEDADIILIGISRTGKTPTCLYLSLHYGIRAANFPLTEDDLEELQLPRALRDYRAKLFGLSLDPLRLQRIRQERLPNSRYASLSQCEYETRQAEALFRKLGLPYVESTMKSIEEIATTIIDMAGL